MNRRDDWPERLNEFIAAQRKAAFAWGGMDCGTFMFGALQAMTGTDAGDWLRGRYASPFGLARCLIDYCGEGSITDALDKLAPLNEWQPGRLKYLQRGDPVVIMARTADVAIPIALLSGEEPASDAMHEACAIWLGHKAVAFGQYGLTAFPASSVARCWHVR